MDKLALPSNFLFEIEGDLLAYYHYLVGSTQPTWLASESDVGVLVPSASIEEVSEVLPIVEQQQPETKQSEAQSMACSSNLWFDLNEPLAEPPINQMSIAAAEHHQSQSDDSEGEYVAEFMSYNEDMEKDEYFWTDSESEEDCQTTVSHDHEITGPPSKKKCKELNNIERANVADKLQQLSENYELPKGSMKKLATKYDVSRWTISRIWQIVHIQMTCDLDIEVHNCKTGKVGRKRCELDIEKLQSTPFQQRTTQSATAKALGIHKSTLHRMVKRGQIKKHRNKIKPYLTEAHKIARVRWVLKSIIPRTIHTIPTFSRMMNIVHIDEKFFCLSKISERYYLAPNEEGPDRKCKNKRFIKKIMFLAAVARPHIMPGKQQVTWDGKIGIWPFVDKVPAKKRSKNRDKGTIETKATTSITQEVIKKKMLEELIPAIRAKWPSHATKTIWIQQDNARPHISNTDPEFNIEASKDGFDMHLINQPAQSPDLNILDLGFFRAIQSIKDQMSYKDEDKLIKAVEDAYNNYDPVLLNYIFLSLQNCMIEILECKGNNNYKLPHMDKAALDRQGVLPSQLGMEKELLERSIWWLQNGSLTDYVADLDDEEYDSDFDAENEE